MVAMTPSLFRQLTVANLVTPFVGIAVDIVRSPSVARAEPFDMWYGILAGMYLLLVAFWIATNIGLCLFARWSRSMTLWMTVLGFILTVIAGASSEQTDGLARALYDLSSLLTGVVLAAAYWSSVSRMFEPGGVKDDLENVFS